MPSAAAARPSKVDALFQITIGPLPPHRGEPGDVAVLGLARPHPQDHLDPGGAQALGPTGRPRGRVGHRDHDPGHPGVDQRLGTRPCAPGVVARLQGDHGGAALGPLTGLGQRHDLGVRPARVGVEALAHHDAVRRPAARSPRPGWGWWCPDRAPPARWPAPSPCPRPGSPLVARSWGASLSRAGTLRRTQCPARSTR